MCENSDKSFDNKYNVQLIENSLKLGFGTKFFIRKVSKNGSQNEIKLIKGFEDNVFIGIFDEEDVDFIICIDNQLSDEKIAFSLSIRSYQTFIVSSGKISFLESLETNGRKLHFKSQNTDEGKLLVAMSADMYGISYEKASIDCSKITFNVNVLKQFNNNVEKALIPLIIRGDKIGVIVKTLTGKSIDINIGPNNTILELKAFIQQKEGIPPVQQRIMFAGKQLDNERTINDYYISDESILHMILLLRGGGSVPLDISQSSTSSQTDSMCDSIGSEGIEDMNASKSANNQKLSSGERGIICFGQKSNQRFKPYSEKFEYNLDYIINPFTIEFRMISKYTPV